MVKLPQEAIAEGVTKWENSLVGWFIGEAPDYLLLVLAVNKMLGWGEAKKCGKEGQSLYFPV